MDGVMVGLGRWGGGGQEVDLIKDELRASCVGRHHWK